MTIQSKISRIGMEKIGVDVKQMKVNKSTENRKLLVGARLGRLRVLAMAIEKLFTLPCIELTLLDRFITCAHHRNCTQTSN